MAAAYLVATQVMTGRLAQAPSAVLVATVATLAAREPMETLARLYGMVAADLKILAAAEAEMSLDTNPELIVNTVLIGIWSRITAITLSMPYAHRKRRFGP